MIDYLLYYKQQIILVHILSPDELNPSTVEGKTFGQRGNDYRDLDITQGLWICTRTLRSFMDDIASFVQSVECICCRYPVMKALRAYCWVKVIVWE